MVKNSRVGIKCCWPVLALASPTLARPSSDTVTDKGPNAYRENRSCQGPKGTKSRFIHRIASCVKVLIFHFYIWIKDIFISCGFQPFLQWHWHSSGGPVMDESPLGLLGQRMCLLGRSCAARPTAQLHFSNASSVHIPGLLSCGHFPDCGICYCFFCKDWPFWTFVSVGIKWDNMSGNSLWLV